MPTRLFVCFCFLFPVVLPAPVQAEVKAIVNAGYFSIFGFAPGSLVTIYGERLAKSTAIAESIPLPKTLNGTQVSFCRQGDPVCYPQELLFVSPNQINFLLRYSYIDSLETIIMVRNETMGSSGWAIKLNWISPGIFAAGYDCPSNRSDVPCTFSPTRLHANQLLRATITDPGYRLIKSDNPARPGGIYVAWLTGLGNDGVVGDIKNRLGGLDMAISLLPRDDYGVRVLAYAVLLYAGASRDFPGLYQINFQIPSDVAWVSGACTSGKAEIWLTLLGWTTSEGMPLPLRALPDDAACK